MSQRLTLLAVAASVLILLAIAARAQSRGDIIPPPGLTPAAPNVVSGSDFGFRIDGMKGDTPVGAFVIRRNGQWVQVELGAGVQRLTLR